MKPTDREAEMKMNDETAKAGWRLTRNVAIGGGVVVVLLWAACLVFAITAYWKDGSAIAGQFGDAFGSVNALFSGLALTAVAATLVLTVYQLILQQRELNQNTNALHDHTDEFQKQLSLNRHQATTDNVFQLLQALRDISDRVHVAGSRSDESFQKLAEDIRKLEMTIQGMPQYLVSVAFMTVHQSNDYALNHYFRMLYQICRFIDEIEGLDLAQRFGFIRIVRAHLSQSALELIMYNSLTPDGSKFYPLLEKYDLLQNLNTERLKYRELVIWFPIHCARSIERSGQGEGDSWSVFADGALFDEQEYFSWDLKQWYEGTLAEHVRRFRRLVGFDAVTQATLAKLEQFEG